MKQKFAQLKTNCSPNFFLGSTNTPNYVNDTNVCPIKNGLNVQTVVSPNVGFDFVNKKKLSRQLCRNICAVKYYDANFSQK